MISTGTALWSPRRLWSRGLTAGALLLLLLVLWIVKRQSHTEWLQQTRVRLQSSSNDSSNFDEGYQPSPYFEKLYQELNWTDSWLADLRPQSLQWTYRDQTQQQLLSGHHVPFHWVITSCERENWGRMLTTTLLSGLLNGLQPESISIAWCRHYDKDNVPSLFYNLRHSHRLEVIYLPDALPVNTTATMLLALMVPQLRNQPDMHLLVTEDDVVFAPDTNAKLAELIRRSQQKAHGAPFLLNLYNPPKEPKGDISDVIAAFNHEDPKPQVLPDLHPSKAGTVRQSRFSYWYGTQGAVFSPMMTKYLSRHFFQVITKMLKITDGFGWGQDHLIKDFLVRYGCSFKFDPDAPCHVFNVEPSLLQHIGTSTATFMPNSNTTKKSWFHMAVDFPLQVAFPGTERPGIW